jgi:hypothetical protein
MLRRDQLYASGWRPALETISLTYVHWRRDDRDIPAQVLNRMLGPVSSASVMVDEIRLRAHARPLDEPGQ